MTNKSANYHHLSSEELIGLIMLSQAENILQQIDPINANVDVFNQGIARRNSAKVRLHAENEGQYTKQPECNTKQKLCFDAQTSHHSAASIIASTNSSELSNASDFAVENSDNNVLSRESFASSIKRSFELLNIVDLRTKNDRKEPMSGLFFFGANIEWSPEEKVGLVDFAKKDVIRGMEKNEHGRCTKRRRRM